MTKTEAVKYMLHRYNTGLPSAIATYNYLTCNGELTITEDTITNYFNEARR